MLTDVALDHFHVVQELKETVLEHFHVTQELTEAALEHFHVAQELAEVALKQFHCIAFVIAMREQLTRNVNVRARARTRWQLGEERKQTMRIFDDYIGVDHDFCNCPLHARLHTVNCTKRVIRVILHALAIICACATAQAPAHFQRQSVRAMRKSFISTAISVLMPVQCLCVRHFRSQIFCCSCDSIVSAE